MGMGTDTAATSSASADFPNVGGGNTVDPSNPQSSTSSPGFLEQIKMFFSDPNNTKAFGDLLKHAGNMSASLGKLPPDAQSFLRQAYMSGGNPTANMAGPKQSTAGPYVGDIASYNIDPSVARRALASLGVHSGY